MTDVLTNSLRAAREARQLSQSALARRVGVSRQAIHAIESGRQVPATSLALRIAQTLGQSVEQLFQLVPDDVVDALTVPSIAPERVGDRVALAFLRGRWVAYALAADGSSAADGVVESLHEGGARVRTLGPPADLARNVVVAGCAPVLGALSQRLSGRFCDARMIWVNVGSHSALDGLDRGYFHIGGAHLLGEDDRPTNVDAVRARFPHDPMLIVRLAGWRQGLITAAGNPRRLRTGHDLLTPGVRFAARRPGAAANKLLKRLLSDAGAPDHVLPGTIADGHAEVALHVALGLADAGIAIENVALVRGLAFEPLTEEHFDLVVHQSTIRELPAVHRFLDTVASAAFKAELEHLPGYDATHTGEQTSWAP